MCVCVCASVPLSARLFVWAYTCELLSVCQYLRVSARAHRVSECIFARGSAYFYRVTCKLSPSYLCAAIRGPRRLVVLVKSELIDSNKLRHVE